MFYCAVRTVDSKSKSNRPSSNPGGKRNSDSPPPVGVLNGEESNDLVLEIPSLLAHAFCGRFEFPLLLNGCGGGNDAKAVSESSLGSDELLRKFDLQTVFLPAENRIRSQLG